MILFGKDRTNTTICALASAEGAAGISVIRISGSDCLSIVRKSARFLPENLASHTIYFGTFIDPSSDELVDEVLISFFANKKSYTGEETIEISCHGSPIIVDKILEILCRAGCKVALNGEFTYRAFLNGKIDLVKAESILGLIHSSTEASAKANLNLLKGSLSNRIKHLENSVLEVLAHIEADIDFSTENLNTFEPQQIVERLQNIIDEITKICFSFEQGKVVTKGISVAICGKPNVGKSSLFNCLLDEDRALVSEFAGTTRDSIDSSIIINGIQVRLIDTAGVRDTDDFVESMGIEKTKEVAAKADYIFYVVSPELESFEADVKYLEGYSDKKIVLILNKADLMDSAGDFAKNVLKQQFRNDVLIASSKNRDVFSVIEFLKNELGQETVQKDVVITNHRQFESLDSALRAVAKATENLKDGYGAEVASLDLKDAYLHLQNVVGSSYDDQVIDKIFKEFCLGK